jgi:L-lactate dehydrogenase
MKDEKSILPVSGMMHGEYGIEGICLSTPAIVGRNGIVKKVPISLNETERKQLTESAATLAKTAEGLSL